MSKRTGKPTFFRIFVLGSGTTLAILYILAFGPKLVFGILGSSPDVLPGGTWEGYSMTALFVFFIIGYGIGWWNRLWGGLTILVAAAAVALPFFIIQRNLETPAIFGSPVFAVGLLYLLLFREESRSIGKNAKDDSVQ